MAHPCIFCGCECCCSGDIDDAIVSKTPNCCGGCGCENDRNWEEDDDTDPEMDPVGWECIGCGEDFDYPGDCPHCGNPLEPYG